MPIVVGLFWQSEVVHFARQKLHHGQSPLLLHRTPCLFSVFSNFQTTATMAASDQIRQMVNFILQEAHEKANEIRVKVCICVCYRGVFSRSLLVVLSPNNEGSFDFKCFAPWLHTTKVTHLGFHCRRQQNSQEWFFSSPNSG